MNGSPPVDPIEELRLADRVDPTELPAASLARVRASVMGEHNRQIALGSRRGRWSSDRPMALGLASLAATLVVAVGLLRFAGGGDGLPGPTGAPQIGLCVEAYSIQTLRQRTLAFDGTVLAVNGDAVTFAVLSAFRGVNQPEMTVTATGMTGGAVTPGSGIALQLGERYLVAGDAGFAWGCGFTQPYDQDVATQWAAALRP